MQDNLDPRPPGPSRAMDDEEEVIALTQIVAASPGPAMPPRSMPEEEPDEKTSSDLGRLAAEIIGESNGVDAPEAGSSRSVPLSLDQLEQALEKVVKKLYSGAIESMVLDVMEKHVQREIAKITALIADAANKEG
jgi:hypothetical protein